MGRVIIEGSVSPAFSEERAIVCSSCRSVIGITREELKRNSSKLNPYTYTDCPICKKQITCDWIRDTYEFASSCSNKKRSGKVKCSFCGSKFKYNSSDVLLKDSAYSLDEYVCCPTCHRLNNVKTTHYDFDDDVD